MSRRLGPQPREWIDRNRQLSFRFEGESYRGYHGDTISTALWAAGVRMLGRSFKYHRPRGIYSLAGSDVNAMLDDGARTNLRGDVTPLAEGLDLYAVNTFGGLRHDRMRWIQLFSKFMPVGFYYKAFHTPRRLFPLYERQIRRVAGLGRIHPEFPSKPTPKDYDFCDLLVVGAGPAGLAAAISAAESGLEVLLVDEQVQPGGSLAWQFARDQHACELLVEMLEQVDRLPNLRVRWGTQAAGYYRDHWVALVDQRRLTKLRAEAMVVATGCFEQPAVFENNDLPGVMLGSAAQRLIHLYAVQPLGRAVVLTANDDGYRVAIDLDAAGTEVAAVVDLRSSAEETDCHRRVTGVGITVIRGSAIVRAEATSGKTGIRAAVITPIDQASQTPHTPEQRIACDGIVMSVGWAPGGGLLYQAGGRFSYCRQVEQLVPQNLPQGVFAAGRVRGVFELEARIDDGRRAGLAAAAHLGRYHDVVPEIPVHRGDAPSHPYPIFDSKRKANFVDLDEDLHLADFNNAHQEGFDSIELLKRYTTVGMGPSQGKLSSMNTVRILARLNGETIERTGTTTSRPFHHPVPMGHLAGRRFHPVRRTPMHAWHQQAGAEMIHAGDWLRPEYYRTEGNSREECILQEAVNVRRKLGLMDVGTLGKFQVRGAGAAEFLDRVYTGRFADQKIGRLRYVMACDEMGVLTDDGIAARLASDRFYVTATSSGAAAAFREMQRLAILWNADVTLVNLTGQWTAMNLVGPRSREVLAKLTDVDLSPQSFPYPAAREAVVAGVQALLLRVGFVGELGYEIHVAAPYGMHVWRTLLDAGAAAQLRPFGVEAQRLLRLEKGHLIVAADTDPLTNPYEVGHAWAIADEKPFFVGQRSLAILRKQPLSRRLAGIAFATDYRGPLPEECHLIIEEGQIAGRVTSFSARSTLGRAIGLAFLRPDLAMPGTAIGIRLSDGRMVPAEVTRLPFYDPQGNRQA